MDDLEAERVLLSKSFKLFSEKLGMHEVTWIQLSEEDYFPKEGHSNYTYPYLNGKLSDGSSVDINRVEKTSDFVSGIPSRIKHMGEEEISPILWMSSEPDLYKEIKAPCRIGCTVDSSTHYKARNKDRGFPGYHLVQVKGLDENRNHISESIYIRDDGSYKTDKIYSELLSVDYDGFNGSITIYPEEMYVTSLMNKFHTGVSESLYRPLMCRGFEEPDGIVGIEYYINRFLNGRSYRRLNNLENLESEDLEEILDSQIMLDDEGSIYSVVDYTISPLDGKMWCISSDGRIHLHKTTITEFSIPPEKESSVSSFDLVPERRRLSLNEDAYMWTFFRALRGPLKNYSIRRIDPDGIQTYLQEDKTWDVTLYTFVGIVPEDGTIPLPENTYDTLRFYSNLNKLGEWHFYCDATLWLGGGPPVTETTRTGILCSSNKAEKSYSTNLENVDKIYFSKSNYLTIVSNLEFSLATENYYKLYNDAYMVDHANNRILVREDYEEVEVNYV